ncbi:hypothetical protein FKP32DRAFT_1689029 [Trametes sanguinea]|nr:hypothetical protein FKP32DRAFT_1689029 [Trametes sanguinea]
MNPFEGVHQGGSGHLKASYRPESLLLNPLKSARNPLIPHLQAGTSPPPTTTSPLPTTANHIQRAYPIPAPTTMLQRRKNLSHKQRREQMMLKRAVKRGDVPPPPPSKPDRRTRKPRNVKNSLHTAPLAVSARKLESSFVKLPKSFLKKTDILASRLPLTRPVPPHAAVFPDVERSPPRQDGAGEGSPDLTCPRRPKWRYDMSKNEVEANEQGLFRKWLEQTDAAVNAWCSVEDTTEQDKKAQSQPQPQEPEGTKEPEEMPHAPTSFERNLEVWRQVWRVTEISEILLILLDSRCPTLHFPPALTSYLSSVSNAPHLRLILVLTKVDIAGPARAAAWTAYLHARHPGLRVVQVESSNVLRSRRRRVSD